MLCAYTADSLSPPFYSDDDDETVRLASIGRYQLPSHIQVSPHAKDLIAKVHSILFFILDDFLCKPNIQLLEKDPSKRISAQQALQHPWLSSSVVDAEAPTNAASTATDSSAVIQSTTASVEEEDGSEDGPPPPKSKREALSLSNEEVRAVSLLLYRTGWIRVDTHRFVLKSMWSLTLSEPLP